MNMISKNLSSLSSEFKDPSVVVDSVTHTDNGVNYALVSVSHTGTNNRQHVGIALDFSTSMSQITGLESKKKIMIDATEIALKQMYNDNIVTVIAYGSHASTIIKNARVGHPDTLSTIVNNLKLQSYLGKTNPASALSLLTRCDQTLLLSDGNFNEGPIDPQVLYNIVGHPLICGSIFPGSDMSELSELSEGTYFNIDCKEKENMHSLLASALSAPRIEASNIVLKHGGVKEHLPSLRNGCKIQYVIPVFGNDIEIVYIDNLGNTITVPHVVTVTGNQCDRVSRALQLQKAAKLARVGFETNDISLQKMSANLFNDMGVSVESFVDLRRESSSQNSQFSIEPESLFCPESCRKSSQLEN